MFYHLIKEGNRAGCLTLNVVLLLYCLNCFVVLFMVSLSGLWYLIRAFSEHTCLLVVLRLGFKI